MAKDKFTSPEPLEVEVDGVMWKRFTCSYRSAEGRFSFAIYAVNHEHADMVLCDLKESAIVDGEVYSERDR